MCEQNGRWLRSIGSIVLLLVLLAAAWPGAVQGQGPQLPTELAQFRLERLLHLDTFPRYPVAAPTRAISPQGLYSWRIEQIPEARGESLSSLALDPWGHPHIAFQDDDVYVDYAYHDGMVWHVETVDSSLGTGMYMSLALDTSGRPHIAYDDNVNMDLKYAYFDGATWHIETVDSVGSVGRYNDIALDPGGRPHISYCDMGQWDLKYAFYDGFTWQIQTVYSDGQVGADTSIALDGQGHPHISFFDEGKGDLMYAYHDGASWHVQRLDVSGTVGSSTSLGLDSAGRPHIGYCTLDTYSLKYAYHDGASWQTTEVEDGGNSCDDVSLVLDGANLPHVVYYRGAPEYGLRYLYFDGATWHGGYLDDGHSGSIALSASGQPNATYERGKGLFYATLVIDMGSWSRLAFASFRDSNWEVYLARGDGAYPARLTTLDAADSRPELNRGATQIAFDSARDGNYEIYTMNTDGSAQTRLTWTAFSNYLPTWSPDGSKIAWYAYPDTQANGEIYVMNADGSGQTRLTWDTDWEGHPTWSPDGTRIAYVREVNTSPYQYQLWAMNADGTGQQPLFPAVFSAMAYPDWSPDGRRIAFSDDFDDNGWFDLAVINVDGTGLTHPLGGLTTGEDAIAPSWAPGGTDIAYAMVYWTLYHGSWFWTDAYVYAFDLRLASRYLLEGSGYDWWPDWQTTDAWAPSSQVSALPAWSGTAFSVQWSGVDTGGAGLRSYDVQVRDGADGVWTDWQLDTTLTSAVFGGQDGHTYYFRSRAWDYAYNYEPYPGGDGDAWTTVDVTPPSAAASSPAYVGTTVFTVTWSGGDAGSGIASYDVQVRDGAEGLWTDWVTGTMQAAASFTGEADHRYYFQCRARDHLGNLGTYAGGDGDTSTLVDLTAPSSAASSPAYALGPGFVVSWSGSDAGSGIASYDVQVREGDGAWTDWLADTMRATVSFLGQLDRTYCFQSRARDLVGNEEPYPGGDGDTCTQTPLYALSGYVLGNREQPVALAAIAASPPMSNTALSGVDGAFALYFDVTGVYSLGVTRSGFGTLPPMEGVVATGATPAVAFYLPPLDDRVVDGGFEAEDLAAWGPAGEVTPVLTETAHTGEHGALLGGEAAPAVVTPTAAFSTSAVVTSAGGLLTSTVATVVVPAGAVSGTVLFTLTGVPTVSLLPGEVQDVGVHVEVVAALSDGTVLTRTLYTLTVRYTDTAWQAAQVADEGTLALWRYDAPTMGWVAVSGTVNVVSNTVMVVAERLGLYALVGQPYAGPWRSVLVQEVVLTPTVAGGTLSLLYRVAKAEPAGDVLRVVLHGAEAVTYTLPLTESGWIHRWWEVPGWAGPTLTVRVEWEQGAREREGVVLDEVSLGPAEVGTYPVYLPLVVRGE